MSLFVFSIVFLFFFVSFGLFFRAPCPLWLKLAGTAFILFASLKYVIYRLLGGSFFSPDLPPALILILEALYGALVVLGILLLLFYIYLAGNWLMARTGMPIPKSLPTGWIKATLAVLALGLGAWGAWQGVKVPEARTVELRLASLPKALDGLSIVQLSDLHIGPLLKGAWLEKVVERVNALDADLIALTGDYVDGHVAEISAEVAPLAKLKAEYGVFGVSGNHEYYWNMREWEKALAGLGVHMLENDHKTLVINGETLVIAGVPDIAAWRFGLPGPDIQKTFAGAPEAVRILLSHQPKSAREYENQAQLILSGHTHGGAMFFLRPLLARFNAGFVKGMYELEKSHLYVSPGTGIWNGFSCRIGNPAEITRIILRSDA